MVNGLRKAGLNLSNNHSPDNPKLGDTLKPVKGIKRLTQFFRKKGLLVEFVYLDQNFYINGCKNISGNTWTMGI